MAKIDEGILGPFSGKVGDVIGSSWHGIPYIKSRPAVFHDAKSPAQLAQRMRMQVAHQFVKSIKNVITIGYRYVAGEQIPYNKAVSYIVKNAIVGEYPDMGIAPNMVMVSQGNLVGAEEEQDPDDRDSCRLDRRRNRLLPLLRLQSRRRCQRQPISGNDIKYNALEI